jgi:hypothetical protein
MLTQKTCHKLIDLALKSLVQNQLHEQFRNARDKTVQIIPPKEEIQLITEVELKQKLKLSSPTLWRWRRKGMPYIKKGKKIYYEFNNVVKYLGGQRNGR